MISPKKVETKDTYLIVYFSDNTVKHIDMKFYLKQWASDAQKLLSNIDRDLSKVYLEDGYAISWKGYNLSIDPETFYQDAKDGYPFEDSKILKDTVAFEVKYENGSSNLLHAGLAISLKDAIDVSENLILGCLPKNFDPADLVRPVLSRRLDVCALCGSSGENKAVKIGFESFVRICTSCLTSIRKD